MRTSKSSPVRKVSQRTVGQTRPTRPGERNRSGRTKVRNKIAIPRIQDTDRDTRPERPEQRRIAELPLGEGNSLSAEIDNQLGAWCNSPGSAFEFRSFVNQRPIQPFSRRLAMDYQRAEAALRHSYDGTAAKYRRDDEIEITTPHHQRLAAKLAAI